MRNALEFCRVATGNVAVMFALSAPVLVMTIGIAIDFSRASQIRSELNFIADHSALNALTPSVQQQYGGHPTDVEFQTAALAFFNSEVSRVGLDTQISGLIPSAVVTHASGSLSTSITINWSANLNTLFGGLPAIGPLMALAGTATADNKVAPNVDLYLLLDNSPSMALPSTMAGITALERLTGPQEPDGSGCAFACHEGSTQYWLPPTNVAGDGLGNLCLDGSTPTIPFVAIPPYDAWVHSTTSGYCAPSTGGQMDNYALAKKNGISLRIDDVRNAVGVMFTAADNAAAGNSPRPIYTGTVYSMDGRFTTGLTLQMATTTNFVSGWAAAGPNFDLMEMYAHGQLCVSDAGGACSSGSGSGYADGQTDFNGTLVALNSKIATPGTGAPGDNPQAVLFWITDGVEDWATGPAIRYESDLNNSSNIATGRPPAADVCAAIKNRGIKLAIVYTEYLPVINDAHYNAIEAPFQTLIAASLKNCASPGLFVNAAIGADLGAALKSLFDASVITPHLTK